VEQRENAKTSEANNQVCYSKKRGMVDFPLNGEKMPRRNSQEDADEEKQGETIFFCRFQNQKNGTCRKTEARSEKKVTAPMANDREKVGQQFEMAGELVNQEKQDIKVLSEQPGGRNCCYRGPTC